MFRTLILLTFSAGMALANGPDKHDQIALECNFPTLPKIVFSYSRQGEETVGVMTVGGRGPVPMSLEGGTMRFEGGSIDGYRFRWSPASQNMDVEKDGNLLINETGKCRQVSFGSKKPLSF